MPKWSNDAPKREKYISRKKIWERDGGVCAMCLRQCKNNGNTPDGWDADHILPVYAGGAGLGLSNVRTLCRYSCHKKVSSLQASERAAELRQVKPTKEKVKKKWGSRKFVRRVVTPPTDVGKSSSLEMESGAATNAIVKRKIPSRPFTNTKRNKKIAKDANV